MKLSNYNNYIKFNKDTVIYNSLTKSIVSVPNDLLLDKNKKILEEIFILRNNGMLVENDCDEYLLYQYMLSMAANRSKSLSITFVLTMECNFKCSYCFEGEKKSTNYKGTKEVNISEFKKIINYIVSATNVQHLDFTFFGGEPLIKFEYLIECSNLLKGIASNKGISCSINVVTNGYLINSNRIQKFKEANIDSFQITLDGMDYTHNKLRPLKNGNETFEQVYNNIKALILSNFEVIININYYKENYNSIIELLNSFPSNIKENVYIKFNKLVSTPCNSFINEDSNPLYDDVRKLYDKLLVDKFKDLDLNLEGSGPCYMDLKNSIIFDNYGNLYKCIYSIGDVNSIISNIFTLNGELNENNINNILCSRYSFLDTMEKCKKCNILPICKGGCRMNKNLRGKNDICNYDKIYREKVYPMIRYYSYKSGIEI